MTLPETRSVIGLRVGACTRWIAWLIAADMVGIYSALGPTWPWIDCGIEFPLLKGVLALFGARASGEWYSLHQVVYEHWREWK